MIEANISTVKNELSQLLRRVQEGEEIVILDRDRPVAKISRLTQAGLSQDGALLLAELEKQGVLIPAQKTLPHDWFKKHPALKIKQSVLQLILHERQEAPY